MRACAKINLSLAITGKRPDGYHTLETIFYPIPYVADELEFSSNDSGKGNIVIDCKTPGVPCDPQKNLCGRAAIAYFERAGYPLPNLTIRLTKQIPTAAGMGGGSSDAAHVLRYLQQQYGLLNHTALHNVAAKLGADIPFFLNPSTSIGRGIGDELTPVPELPERLPIRIFAPSFPVSAAWTYKHTDIAKKITLPPRTDELIHALREKNYSSAASLMRNDLEDCLYDKFPILTILRDRILSFGALKVMVTGSGPTLFALFESEADANQANIWTEFEKEFHILVL